MAIAERHNPVDELLALSQERVRVVRPASQEIGQSMVMVDSVGDDPREVRLDSYLVEAGGTLPSRTLREKVIGVLKKTLPILPLLIIHFYQFSN